MLDGAQQIAVEKCVEVARQPALNANLGGAAFPSLPRTAHHFLKRKRISAGGSRAAPKAAKTASHETDIGEVDVAIYDVSDGVSDGLSAQLIGDTHKSFHR